MRGEFKDHFSDASSDYRQYRPLYPDEMYSYLASISPAKRLAWDCATGSGQSATKLSQHFSNVIATDASAEQIQNTCPRTGICYRVARAEQSGIDDRSVDLITVAQALHWFDISAFAAEVDRVLKPGGVLAVWAYNLLNVQPIIDRHINKLYGSILSDYWPEERALVENSYRDVSFSFHELTPPAFQMTAEWNLTQLLGYLRTWSALKLYRKQHGIDPIKEVVDGLSETWGDTGSARFIHWPLSLRVWKKL